MHCNEELNLNHTDDVTGASFTQKFIPNILEMKSEGLFFCFHLIHTCSFGFKWAEKSTELTKCPKVSFHAVWTQCNSETKLIHGYTGL